MSNSNIYINGDNGKEYNLFPYPSWKHERIISNLNSQFERHFNNSNCNRCDVFGSNTGLFIGNRWDLIKDIVSVQEEFKEKIEQNKQYDVSISPDLMIICNYKSSDFDYRGYHKTPLIIVEVASPSTQGDDLTWKKDIYEAIQVKEYWFISDISNVNVFRLIDSKFKMFKYQAIYKDNGKLSILEVTSTLFDGAIKFDSSIIDDIE